MHRDYRKQERIVLSILVMFVLSIVGSIGYLSFSVHSIKADQSKQFESLSQKIENVDRAYGDKFSGLQSLEAERLTEVNALYTELQKSKQQDSLLLDKVQELEQNNVNLQALTNKMQRTSGDDLSGVVGKSLRSSVGVTTPLHRASGAVITGDGLVVTNYHVVSDSETVQIHDYYGRVMEGKVVVFDEIRDLAIIKTGLPFKSHFTLGNSDELIVGEKVVAVGNPEKLDFTVTQGIISSARRVFFDREGAFIQTDVPINKGSSGGSLVNMDGELIGINTFKIRDSESLGFSIPSNDVKKLLDSITTG